MRHFAIIAVIVLAPLAAQNAYAFKEKDLATLVATKSCVRCNPSGADLKGVDLSGADLQRTNLRDADLKDAILAGANLDGGDLRRADLEKAVLTGANRSAISES